MKAPENFDFDSMSFTEDGTKEFLRWVDISENVKLYPQFFKTELVNIPEGVKHFVTDER